VVDGAGTLVARWRAGDQQAAAELFRRYVTRLTALARSRLSAQLAGRVDPEDVVQSVYRCFFADARAGRYEVERGGDLWQLLVTITLHKLQEQVRQNSRRKRAVQRQQNFGSEESLMGLQPHMLGHEPSPVEALALADQLDQLMRDLEPLHRRMLELRLPGHTVEEIAAATERTERTVRRVLDRITQQLQRRLSDNAGV
jgi:RNA polymerase sigma factor (sigma-70 family)